MTVASSLTSLKTAKTKRVFVQVAITADGSDNKKLYTSTCTTPEKALVYSKTGAKMTNAPVLESTGDTTENVSSQMVLTLMGAPANSRHPSGMMMTYLP